VLFFWFLLILFARSRSEVSLYKGWAILVFFLFVAYFLVVGRGWFCLGLKCLWSLSGNSGNVLVGCRWYVGCMK